MFHFLVDHVQYFSNFRHDSVSSYGRIRVIGAQGTPGSDNIAYAGFDRPQTAVALTFFPVRTGAKCGAGDQHFAVADLSCTFLVQKQVDGEDC